MVFLKCKLFTEPEEDPKLEACLLHDHAHILQGNRGGHVRKIQVALNRLSQGPGRPNFNLKEDGWYGPKTAAAVKAYKAGPHGPDSEPILQPWQQAPDDIVGKRTMQALDDEMEILENESPAVDRFVATTSFGDPRHDHNKCPKSPGHGDITLPDGRVGHIATPVNPQGFGRKVNIGGEYELAYLGFEDFLVRVPHGNYFGPARPFTETLKNPCASDICMRSVPLNKEIKAEVNRIALPGCRLTLALNSYRDLATDQRFLMSMGPVIEQVAIFKKPESTEDPNSEETHLMHVVLVIAMRGDGRFEY